MKTLESFLEEYEENIAPRIRKIDVLLREQTRFSLVETAKVLEIPLDEVYGAIEGSNAAILGRREFLYVMRRGSSQVCQMLLREVECGCPQFYSPRQVAYIYGLKRSEVEDAFDALGLSQVPQALLSQVFERIPARF